MFKRLLPHVDRFSVMTYDFSVTMGRGTLARAAAAVGVEPVPTALTCVHYRVILFAVSAPAGPNAPLRWLEYTVDALARGDPEVASKILLGMPFYG